MAEPTSPHQQPDDQQRPAVPSEPSSPMPVEAKDTVQPSRPAEGLSAEELAEAKRYGRWDLGCSLADKLLDVIYLGVVAAFLARPLDTWLQGWSLLGNLASLRLVALLWVVTLGHMLVSFPLSLFAGHVLEHWFGMSRLSLGGWLWRYAKRNLLALALTTVLMAGLYWLIWTTGSWWWLAAAAAFFAVSVLLGQLAPVLILPLFYKIERLDAPELLQRIDRLAEGTGLTVEGVYRMQLSAETVKANAMLAGLGRTRRVLLGDTLLDEFSNEEIEVVFAHEIGHHVHRHIRKMLLAGLCYSVAGFWLCDWLLRSFAVPSGTEFSYAALPVYTLPLVLLILTVFAQAVEPLQNAISRRYERQSDRYALQRTDNAPAYISAFRKLARLNKGDPNPPRLEVALFHSHPPIRERIAMAEAEAHH